jgi:uncharacterized protein (TIGR02147 family)
MSTQPGIFHYKTYRDYLNDRLGSHGLRSGLKKRAAETLQVHTSLISQILRGSCDLSLEQAEKMNAFLGHSDEEARYFLLLLLKDRSGTTALRNRFEGQIEELKVIRLDLSKRVAKEKEISEADQERFYSSYLFAAIHVLSSIPRLSKVSELSRLLGASEAEVQRAIDFLKRLKLVVEKQGHLSPGIRHVHLGSKSRFISNHHLNWRLKAIDKIRENAQLDLHYSGAMSLSEEDVLKIKEILAKAISEATEVAVSSKESVAYVMGLDFFKLTKS